MKTTRITILKANWHEQHTSALASSTLGSLIYHHTLNLHNTIGRADPSSPLEIYAQILQKSPKLKGDYKTITDCIFLGALAAMIELASEYKDYISAKKSTHGSRVSNIMSEVGDKMLGLTEEDFSSTEEDSPQDTATKTKHRLWHNLPDSVISTLENLQKLYPIINVDGGKYLYNFRSKYPRLETPISSHELMNDLQSKEWRDFLKHFLKLEFDLLNVPGSAELPLAAQAAIQELKPDAIVAIGVLLKGETDHYDYIAHQVGYGLQKVAVETCTPVVSGVLTCRDIPQVKARINGLHSVSGFDWGKVAIDMVEFKNKLGSN